MRILIITVSLFVLLVSFIPGNKEPQIGNEKIAVVFRNGKIQAHSKEEHKVKAIQILLPGKLGLVGTKDVVDELWGKGQAMIFKHDNVRETMLTIYEHSPFVHILTRFGGNASGQMRVSKTDIASFVISEADGLSGFNMLGTGGLEPVNAAKGSYTYSMLADPGSRNSLLTAWLTQFEGMGTFLSAVPAAGTTGNYMVKAGLEFGNFLVQKGHSRSSDILLVGFFKDGREGLETYGDYLAKAYKIKLPQKPNVYCTWYHRDISGSGASTEPLIKENAIFAQRELAPFGLSTLQIDDHWQSSLIPGLTYKNTKDFKGKIGGGPLKTFSESNFNFPSGMAATAKNIQQHGFTPGIWFMPFAGDRHNAFFDSEIFAKDAKTGLPFEAKKWSGTIIDATSPKGEAFLRDRFKRIYKWGYRYFKVDGLHTGMPSENIYVNRAFTGGDNMAKAKIYNDGFTFVQCFRKGMKLLREEAPDAFILGCTVTQNMAAFGSAFGMVDAMRVGPDNDNAREGVWKNVIKGADYAGNLYFLNNKVWYNDPDPYYVRETNPLDKARWMVSWQAVAGVLGTSSIQYAQLPAQRLELIKRALPTHNYFARPVDILENLNPSIWLVGNDRMKLVGLFNWKEKDETVISYSLEKMGLGAEQAYEVFDFWENKYLGTINRQMQFTLKPASCAVLALKPVKNNPQVISSSRHITQGLIDILEESWQKDSRTLSGKSDVVSKDRYELRIVLPDKQTIPKEAICDGKAMEIKVEGNLARIAYIPEQTKTVAWEIHF